ncbi:MAG: PQQ-binding-like beta-propeller repeat protein [Deltaproteobacteria bacterium]|nr:PQQ-binding-like beta-propeller repeat protein [Deltaproteobacteria bacterium]
MRARLWIAASAAFLLGAADDDAAREKAAQAEEAAKKVASFESAGSGVDPETLPGAPLYKQYCASCHEGQVPKAPAKNWLTMMPVDRIHASLTTGVMSQQAAALSDAERIQLAEYLTGDALADAKPAAEAPSCRGYAALFDASAKPRIASWGFDLENSRSIPKDVARLDAEDVPKLELAWALRFPGALRARSQPTHAFGAIYVGSHDGTVYALDPASGCVRWRHQVSAEVRTAIVVRGGDDPLAFFGDILGRVHAVDPFTGAPRWTVRADDHPNTTITGTPTHHDGRLYVPVSSLEVTSAADPNYECCSFRGSVLALDAASGETVWKRYVIDETPTETARSPLGTRQLAPSGAPVWNAPTIDPKRGELYVGTGENYSSPANDRSDAVIALSLATGKLLWTWQAQTGDAWNVGCMIPNDSCPVEKGPDFDLAAGTTLFGNRILLGLKTGEALALSRDGKGRVEWRQRVGRGGIQGGVHWGTARESGVLFVPINDQADARDGKVYDAPPRPGLYAIDAKSGALLWESPAPDVCGGKEFCDPGISAAVTAIPGVVFAGHLDGRVRAYDAKNGAVLWTYDTTKPVTTVSGEPSLGGSIGGPGPVVADGMLFVNSGYGLYYHMPGGTLFAFRVREAK